jgi:hypothetical protein
MSTISTEAIEIDWLRFTEEVRNRLLKGEATYGDRSFTLEPSTLVGEIEQELLDVMGWGFILWWRLQRVAKVLAPKALAHE